MKEIHSKNKHDLNLRFINLADKEFNRESFDGYVLAAACMENATFIFCSFKACDLRKINAIGANFHGSDFTGANLFMAELYGVSFKKANLAHVDLRTAKHLDSCCFQGAHFHNTRIIKTKENIRIFRGREEGILWEHDNDFNRRGF